MRAQVRTDRYYAAHLLGDLKDPRGVDVLIPLLDDDDVGYIVPWSLAQIGIAVRSDRCSRERMSTIHRCGCWRSPPSKP